MCTKGFVTLATGDERYFKAAANLLKSYLLFHSENSKFNVPYSERLPFAIVADKHNEYTDLFDKVIILENPTKSYYDKIQLLNNIPFTKTVFIEADCLAYSDLNEYFEVFKNADDFSVFGRTVPTSSREGWFCIEEVGKYKKRINFIPRFHSAVMYMKKGQPNKCLEMYNICSDIYVNYDKYMIGGSREAIDDKLLAISSAVVGCRPTTLKMYYYNYYPQFFVNKWNPKPRIHKLKNSFTISKDSHIDRAIICHWSNDFTKMYLYIREVHSINALLNGESPWLYIIFSGFVYLLNKLWTSVYLVQVPRVIAFLKRIYDKVKKGIAKKN